MRAAAVKFVPMAIVNAPPISRRLAEINARLLAMGGILLRDEAEKGEGEVATQGFDLRRPEGKVS